MRNHTPNTLQTSPYSGSVSGPALTAGSSARGRSSEPGASAHPLTRDRRGGAVIIVVLALLSLMIFLGVFFFEFVQEEQLAAGNYAANPWDVLNPDRYLDSGEKTIIVGPDASRPMGALSAPSQGAYHSLVAHTTGSLTYGTDGQLQPTDVLPHNGAGITTTYIDNDADGLCGPGDFVQFDMNGDGQPDAMLDPSDPAGLPLFAINYSPSAQYDSTEPTAVQFDSFSHPTPAKRLPIYQPDVEYTYPDINNLFLAYDTIDPTTGRRILVPSFHRPDLFLSKRDTNFSDLYTDPSTQRLVMRPHSGNLHPDGITYRFPNAAFQAQSGDTSRLIQPFPFTVDSDNDGTNNEMGIYSDSTGAAETGYDLDVDLTGEGTPDGIWMDLGHELVDLPDGRQFVPLYSFYILDGDALLNINTAGNFEGALDSSVPSDRFSTFNALPFSVSNTGASASEINPLRVFTADPSQFTDPASLLYVQSEYAYTFGIDPTMPQPTGAMANMDWTHLAMGRSLRRSGSRLTGRNGEEQYVPQYYTGLAATLPVLPPRAGVTGVDDDYDNLPDGTTIGNRYAGGAQRYLTNTLGSPDYRLYDPRPTPGSEYASVVMPQGSHPIDAKGTGSGMYTNTATVRTVVAGVTGSPVVWPQYPAVQPTVSSSWEAQRTTTLTIPADAVYPIENLYPYGLVAPFTTTPLFDGPVPATASTMSDEEDEARIRNPDRISDDLFRPEENLRFQASDADIQRVGGTSRAENLALMNLKYARDAADIRRRLTTDSWDLNELSFVPSRYNGGTSLETSEWIPADLIPGPPIEPARYFFPPAMGVGVFTDTDPIRPEVRALLASEDSDYPASGTTISNRRESFDFMAQLGFIPTSFPQSVSLWRQPLNLNKLLVGFDLDGNPIFRNLMPHPDMVGLEYQDPAATMPPITIPAMIHDHSAPIPLLISNMLDAPSTDANRATTATIQEWWARYDRQRMARDIYTLLYLVGAPNDLDPLTAAVEGPAATAYPTANRKMVREMAQFAVNYVDALDRDDVITKFEYDDDLSDGWATAPTKAVYGIERASLSFSEVQFLQTTPQMSDYSTTLHDEQDDVHQYLHIELRNSAPLTIDLAEGWRISRVVRNGTGGTGTIDRSVEFKTKGFGTASPFPKQIDPGQNFLIATHDGTVKNDAGTMNITSDLYADVTGGTELESILPYTTNTILDSSEDPDPQTDLDLCVTGRPAPYDHEEYFTHVAGTSPYMGTRLAEGEVMGTVAAEMFDLVLERRQNPRGVEAATNATSTSSMGEWIEVDRFMVDSGDFGGTGESGFDPAMNLQADCNTAALALHSLERRQSFDPVQMPCVTASPIYYHTLRPAAATKHLANSVGTTPFTLWQPHFDRDFTSAYELLSVPLYGNWPLTELVTGLNMETTAATPAGTLTANAFYREIHGGTQFNLAPGATNLASGQMSGDYTAGVRFNFPNGVPAAPYRGWNSYNYQNCWYRLFDFVTVPRRADQQSEELLNGANNVAGSMKPVFRVPGKINLNTVRDETVLAALIDDEVHLAYGNGTADNFPGGRNWFQELLHSRDGIDYFAGAGGASIPNSIVSRPFRGASKKDPLSIASTDPDNAVENGLLRSADGRGLNTVRDPSVAATSPTVTNDFSSGALWGTEHTLATNWQGLFDAGDLANGTGIDHHTRNRILAKVANNSTNKSHVFFVWAAVGYFEAHQITVGGVPRTQIGARLTDIPIHRRFSVVDMSKLDDAYDTQTNTFDEKKFIIYQKRLR